MGKFSELAERLGLTYSMGDTVFSQGDIADCMYLVFSGLVSVFREGDTGRISLGELGPGEIFGEMALVDNRPRSATVEAVDDSILIPITADFFMENVYKDPGFIFQITETLIHRIESTADSLNRKAAMDKALRTKGRKPDDSRSDIDMIKFLKLFEGYADPGKYLEFAEGEEIFREGDMGDLMFIILDGSVQITVAAGDSILVLADLERGDFFGESALLTAQARSATATAAADVTVLPVVRKDLVDGLMKDPEAALQLVKILILRLRGNLEMLVGTST